MVEPTDNADKESFTSHDSWEKDEHEEIIREITQRCNNDDVKLTITDDPAIKSENKPVTVFKRRPTIMKDQLEEGVADEIANFLDCGICKNILNNAVECTKCRKAFCRLCAQDYVQLHKGAVACPSCRHEPFTTGEPHPMLTTALLKLKLKCEHAAQGCPEKLTYAELGKHRSECQYVLMICQNFGCSERILRKDFEQHDNTCKFRVERCKKCRGVVSEDHDCITVLCKRMEKLEATVIA